MMRPHPLATRSLLCVLIGAIGTPPLALAEQLPLVQYPAGSASRQPAPNVVLTLDDSGSMGSAATTTTGMYALKQALQEVFSGASQNVPDGSIRLAWNAMNKCRTIPATDAPHPNGCAANNVMRVLDATHRANFLAWVGKPGTNPSGNGSSLTANAATGGTNGTPTHRAYLAAADYLKNASPSDINGPWANVPGQTLEPVLSCRRSYVLLMTDGGWNWTFSAYGNNVARGGSFVAADGVYNGNASNVSVTLPDGTYYDKDSAQSRIYRDTYSTRLQNGTAHEYVTSLANLAFYYWATDIAPTLANNLPPLIRQSGPQIFGTGANAVTLQEYWNPKNNPATWQHVQTYTIGFGDAANWRTTGTGYTTFPIWNTTTNDTYGGDFPLLVSGGKAFPDPVKGTTSLNSSTTSAASNNEEARQTEMWHMALNGRGRFVPATSSSADLVRAFKEIFGEIVADTKTPITSFANAASSISRSPTTQYTSGYEAATWKGYVLADTIAQTTGAATADQTWGEKVATPPNRTNITTADKLDALNAAGINSRLILTWRDLTPGGGGTSFEWAADQTYLSTAQKALLRVEGAGTVTEEVAQQRLNYIRGDRSLEGTSMRTRASRQGDIVNSALWYVADPVSNYSFDKYVAFAQKHKKRLPMVYVGGNDGMLHGFSGVDGSEKIAYVPRGVIQNLPDLTRTNYQHRYYVDGSPFSGDVNWGDSVNPDWRTLLVGTLGAGGKGYFVLDVTTPGSTATDDTAIASNFLKANAASLVVMDKTAHASETFAETDERRDIGHLMVAPVLEDGNAQKTTQVVRMNNGRWAVVMGNGYNSTNERPVLLIQYLDGDRALLRIPAATAGANVGTNGLSAPRLVDIDGNGSPDVVYAGDLRGNLWKFDVSAATAASWGVAFSGQPLYSAAFTVGNVSTPQPITAPPIVRANERGAGGLMVAFGTGRNITEGDRTSTGVQTFYSVLDNTRYKLSSGKVVVDTSAVTPAPVGSGVSDLVQQTVSDTAIAGSGASGTRTFWTVSQNDVLYTGAGAKKGWYLNLPATGERVLAQMSFYDESNIIELISEVPGSGGSTAGETCAPPATEQKKYRTLVNIMDGKRPSVQVMDTNGDGVYNLSDQNTSRMTAATAENRLSNNTKELRLGADRQADALARMPEIPLRPNWRQLQ